MECGSLLPLFAHQARLTSSPHFADFMRKTKKAGPFPGRPSHLRLSMVCYCFGAALRGGFFAAPPFSGIVDGSTFAESQCSMNGDGS